MYSEWASLQDDIQCDKANQSVLHKFPAVVGRDVACTVVKHIASSLSLAANNSEPSNLNTDKDVKWAMEILDTIEENLMLVKLMFVQAIFKGIFQVLCFGLSLPLVEHETIKECVNVYCEWLSACTSPKLCVPQPVKENPNPYAQDIIHHLLNLFVPRPGAVIDLVKRQALYCHRVLRCIEDVAVKSNILTRGTWETLLRFLLAANDSLLSPPTEKDDIGDHLCERVLSVLFEMWLLACHKCFPSPSLWKTFRNMCVNWRHHEALITQWHKVNHNLTSRLIKFMYGSEYPELQLNETESQFISPDMTDDCVAQCWFRFLHIIQNPVDLCHPEIIGGTPKFLQLASRPGEGLDPTQHECLQKLPYIFYKAMRGISILVNACLGISQSLKAEEELTQPQTSNRHSVSVPTTPPGQRKSSRPISVLTLTQKGSSKSSSVVTTPKSAVPPPSNFPGQLLLDSRQPLAPARPQCNSILHMFGAWLFDAALARVRLQSCHRGPTVKARTDRRTNSFTDTRQGSISLDYHADLGLSVDNTYEAGRAEALGALCRIFCAHKTGEEILPVYYSRFYIAMYYGLQTLDDSLSGQVLASILFNSCDLFRVDLDGVQILVPYILDALQLILSDQSPRLKLTDSNVDCHSVELRRSCIQLLLSLLCLPLHFKDLEIKDIVSSPNTPVQSMTFISLKKKIMELLLQALFNAKDSTNTQMLLGGLMLIIQDQAMCEAAEQTTLQHQHDLSGDSDSHGDTSQTSVNSLSSDSYEPSYHRLSVASHNLETAYGLFGRATSLVCHRLMASWKTDLNTALAAMELLGGLAKVNINPPNLLMCKRTVKWICEFIVYQCSRPAPSHSRDLHSMIVAAFKCLTLWLVEHSRLMYDKECLINVLEVVELGISGSKSQKKTGENHSVSVKDSKSVSTQNRASDPPKFKGDKQLMPASMRVKDAAEAVLTCIIEHVGAFPPPCGPESLFSLLDEKSLLKYCKGVEFSEQASPFRYFVLENSIIVGLLEQPLGNVQDPLPTVTALIRGPFGRHAWTMQLRHSPRNKNVTSKSHLGDPGRPLPMENVGTHHNVKHRHFPESVDKITLTKADKSIPTLESLVTEKERANLTKLKSFIEKQIQFENQINNRSKQDLSKARFPNPETECKPPKVTQEFQTARLFLSHYGFLSLEALKEPKNSSIPPALVMLDTTNSGLFTDLEVLDAVTARDNDTVHVFYVKSGQKLPQDILSNVTSRCNVQPQFLEFLHSLGWPVDIRKHAGWTGHVSTSWKITEPEDLDEDDFQLGTGGCIYDGRQQVLYWADVSSEVAFVVPSIETYNSKMLSVDSSGERSPLLSHHPIEKFGSEPTHKPKSLSLERTLNAETGDKSRMDKDSPSSPQDVPPVRLRNQRRQPAHMIGPDTKVFVVWLENFEDQENFPSGELLGVTSTGMDQFVMTSISSTSSTHKLQEKDIFIIFIHALKNGLFRIHMQGQTNRVSMAIPLVDGMVVSRRVLGTMVRQTAINICRRKRLESEGYQPPHVRRKHRIQEIVKNYHLKMSEPEFYTALFQDVPK